MAFLNVKTSYSEYKECWLRIGRYCADDSMAIEIWNREDGPIARITVYIAGSRLAEDEVVIDTNNCPWAEDFIMKYGLGIETARTVRSGFCEYPVVKLDVKKMRNIQRWHNGTDIFQHQRKRSQGGSQYDVIQ